MSEGERRSVPRRDRPGLIDVTVPNAARTADYLIGGSGHFVADREAAHVVTASAPAIERIPAEARAFRHRVITYLSQQAGLAQFLDVGTGLVPPGATHELAQSINPGSRVVYAESDPMVRAGAQALIGSSGVKSVYCVDGDIADVHALLAAALWHLDPGRPVAVLLLSTLAHVPTTIAAARAVTALMAAVPAGSHVVIYHLASDIDPALPAAARQWNKNSPTPLTLRSRADISSLVAGLDLVSPGVVPVTEWRPDPAADLAVPVPVHGVVARKR